MRLIPSLALVCIGVSAQAEPVFSAAERAKLVSFWNAPGRYRVSLPPEAAKTGPWQVRLTPEASLWFHKYQATLGLGKIAPTQDAKNTNGQGWETWIEAKLAYDRWVAQQAADAANAALPGEKTKPNGNGNSVKATAAPQNGNGKPTKRTTPPPPGPIPESLRAAVGNPPPFAAPVTPLLHVITFDDNESYSYPDHVLMRPRYAYYRFPQGTVAYGTFLKDMPDAELNALFADAGMTPSEQRIMKAVSKLEGGFETVNTYDTGFVSIGFIQCITWDDGRGSLIDVMLRQRVDDPASYARDFRAFGIDVDPTGTITIVDPGTGAELVGPDAVQKIIADKRLTAVFQKAGRHSRAFRIAQIKIAKSRYWPANDPVSVTINGRVLTGNVSDIIKSEAGMATLFDRKVNRGNIAPFVDVVTKVMTERQLTELAAVPAYEKEIVAALKYRVDFLTDKSLSQPPDPPAPPGEMEWFEEMPIEEQPVDTSAGPLLLMTVATLLCQLRFGRVTRRKNR
jgi:hypothetical protein